MVAQKDLASLSNLIRDSLGTVATFFAPMVCIGIVLAPHLVGLITGLGSKNQSAVVTAQLLQVLLLGLCAHGVTGVLMRIFYSLGDTLRPTFSDFICDFCSAAIAMLLLPSCGIVALAVAISASAWIQAVLLSWQIVRRLPQLFWWDLFGQQLLPFALALPAALTASLVATFLPDGGVSPVTDLVRLVAGGSAAVAVYLVALFAIQPPASTPLAVALFKAVPVMRRLVRLGGARSRWSADA
jgi:peptidoglycan biosynthesis protein MviN/MurJ (putative lipid II flippase)